MKKKILIIFLVLIISLLFYFLLNTKDKMKDYKTVNNPDISEYTPVLVNTVYSTNETIVADYVLEPTGDSTIDRTDDIQNALNICLSNRGGTVFLKSGIYRVSRTIQIPRGCTLYGDWQDPDTPNPSYGTIITVDVNNITYDSTDVEKTGLFKLSSGSGAVGLTIYYINQGYYINDNDSSQSTYKDQPWTFYYGHGELDSFANNNFYRPILFTMKNITLINSVRGIGESISESNVSEMVEVDNVKGTVLYKGLVLHNSSDVGTINNMTLKPDYWVNANLNYLNTSSNKPNSSELVSFIKKISGIGLYISDVEMYQYANITISGYKYGIYIPGSYDEQHYGLNNSRDAMGSGLMYNLNILNCEEGIHAGDIHAGKNNERHSYVHLFLGYQISHSYIEGSAYSIFYDSGTDDGIKGVFKLKDVRLNGSTHGYIIYNNDLSDEYSDLQEGVNNLSSQISLGNIYLSRKTKTTGNNIISLDSNSNQDDIQYALNKVGVLGGGVVYLKPGIYQINKQIIVPENVLLRGSSSVLNRYAGKPGQSGHLGTVININPNDIGINYTSTIELAGNNAGVSGIVFIYEENNNLLQGDSPNYVVSAPTIGSHNTEHVYITNVTISGAAHGIGMDHCKYFTISNVATTSFESFINIVNSEAGLIKNTLGNSTVLSLNNLYNFSEGYFRNLIDVTHNRLFYIRITNSKNIESLNNFVYGSRTYMLISNSSGYFINNGNDSFPDITNDSSNGVFNMYNLTDSDIVVINSHRFNGAGQLCTISDSNNKVSIYNSLALILTATDNTPKYEKDIIGSNEVVLISSSAIPEYVSTNLYNIGDVNKDGVISTLDYIQIRKHIMGLSILSDEKQIIADVNNDRNVSVQDYIQIRKHIMGIINLLN